MQSIRTTTSNWSFRMWVGEFCPILALWQPFWIFGGHFELFCSLFLCYDIKFKYSWLPTYANKTASQNNNFKLVFYGALSKNFAMFGPFGGHFDFFWRPSCIFIGSSCINTSNWNTCLLITCQEHAISKNYSLKFEFKGVHWWILPNLRLCGGHFEFFGGHFGFSLVRYVLNFQSWVHPSTQYAKIMQSIRTTALNLR